MRDALRQAAVGVDQGDEVTDDAILEASGEEGHAGKSAGDNAGKKTQASDEFRDSEDTDPEDDAEEGADGEGDNQDKQQQDSKDKTQKPNEQKPGDKKAADAKDGKKGSPYDEARKERERYDRNWKKFQEEQTAHAKRVKELEERERAFQQREQQFQLRERQRTAEPLKDKLGYTAKDYKQFIEHAKENGDLDLVKTAEANLAALEKQEAARAQEFEQQNQQANTAPDQTPGTPEFRTAWNGHLEQLRASEEYADLKNKDSELFKSVATLLNNEPRLSRFPDGIRIAAEISRLRIIGRTLPEKVTKLTKDLDEANKELKKLRLATTPAAGDGESRGSAKRFEELSPAEQKAHLRARAQEEEGSD